VITNDVSDYINSLVRIAHIICNQHLFWMILPNTMTNFRPESKPIILSKVSR